MFPERTGEPFSYCLFRVTGYVLSRELTSEISKSYIVNEKKSILVFANSLDVDTRTLFSRCLYISPTYATAVTFALLSGHFRPHLSPHPLRVYLSQTRLCTRITFIADLANDPVDQLGTHGGTLMVPTTGIYKDARRCVASVLIRQSPVQNPEPRSGVDSGYVAFVYGAFPWCSALVAALVSECCVRCQRGSQAHTARRHMRSVFRNSTSCCRTTIVIRLHSPNIPPTPKHLPVRFH